MADLAQNVQAGNVVLPMASGPEPSYIYTPDGIFFVPHWYIERDKNLPVQITTKYWKAMQEHHSKFTAVNFLQYTTVRAENIVALTLVDPANPHGAYKRCHWFVRVAVQGGSKLFKEAFGENFLWQLPYGTCTRIVQEVKAYELSNHIPGNVGSALIRNLRPTSQEFQSRDWPDLKPVTKLDGYYDKLFAMSVKPCKFTIARRHENPMPKLLRLARPQSVDMFNPCAISFSEFPDDVSNHIFQVSASQWITSHIPSDWKAVLALRAVCRSAKDIVENQAQRALTGTLSELKHCLVSGDVRDIFLLRDKMIHMGLSTLSFVLDTNQPKFINMARLRADKRPGTLPPPRKTREQILATLKRVTDANRSESDAEETTAAPSVPCKTAGRLRLERDNAFMRRQLKRRRLLFERNRLISGMDR